MKTTNLMVGKEKFIIRWTEHALDRLALRFVETDKPLLEKVIAKAIEKNPLDYTRHNQPITKWTHPAFGITVVFQRQGLNAVDMITEWKQGDDDARY